MNQSNTTHILALLLALILALSCTLLVFTTLQLRRSTSLLLEISEIGLDANATVGNLTTATMKPPTLASSDQMTRGSSIPLLALASNGSWAGNGAVGGELKSAHNHNIADFEADHNGQLVWRRQKRKHYRRLHKHRYKHKSHQQHRTR